MIRFAVAKDTSENDNEDGSRLSSLGVMGGVLAHEISQPVTAASQFLDAALTMVRASGGEKAELEAILAKAAEQVEKIGEIVGRMQSFVRSGQPSRRPARPGAIARDAIASLPEGAVSGIEFVVNIGPGADEIDVDPVQMEQVFANIVGNACEALEYWDNKRIEITATREESQILIQVADSGPGISREKLGRVFDPLFTTRETGLGLGLALCRSIVEAHGGTIWADQAPSGGALFNILLPLSPAGYSGLPEPLRPFE
jgi:C4-dicarboxylate-specific signal transduction histidine kinase